MTANEKARQLAEKINGVYQFVSLSNVSKQRIAALIEAALNEHAKELQELLNAEQLAHDQIASLCFEAGGMTEEGTSVSAVRSLTAKLQRVEALLNEAAPIVALYCCDYPKWLPYGMEEQDPSGCHATLERLRAALSPNISQEGK